jgi:hypothetical protein
MVNQSLVMSTADTVDPGGLHLARNRLLLESAGALQKARCGPAELLLEFSGHSDWSKNEIHFTIENMGREEAVLQLTDLACAVFLGRKPDRPAVSRWTGLAGAASFFLLSCPRNFSDGDRN